MGSGVQGLGHVFPSRARDERGRNVWWKLSILKQVYETGNW